MCVKSMDFFEQNISPPHYNGCKLSFKYDDYTDTFKKELKNKNEHLKE